MDVVEFEGVQVCAVVFKAGLAEGGGESCAGVHVECLEGFRQDARMIQVAHDCV